MMFPDTSQEPESYKDYRNKMMNKHYARFREQLRQINETSLTEKDKEKLRSYFLTLLK